MPDRCLLHQTKLEDFKNWLIKDGWTIESTKGLYEVLRARKSTKKNPLIVYKQLDKTEHYTVQSRDMGVVRAYIRSNRKINSLKEDTNQ